MTLRTAVIGVGHLGRHHARLHAALTEENRVELVSVCNANEDTARTMAAEFKTNWTIDEVLTPPIIESVGVLHDEHVQRWRASTVMTLCVITGPARASKIPTKAAGAAR